MCCSAPQIAERLFREIRRKLDLLREHPQMFPLYHDDRLRIQGYRLVVIGSYLLFYLIDDKSLTVDIVRILYGKRDVPHLVSTLFSDK